MGIFKERERKQPDIEQRIEGISPLTIERKEVVTPTTTVFKAQVMDDQGRPLIETPENKEITIEIPHSQLQLQTQAKGSIDEAASWFASFWLRLIEKATILGGKITHKPNVNR